MYIYYKLNYKGMFYSYKNAMILWFYNPLADNYYGCQC